jgi:hypothetical protein
MKVLLGHWAERAAHGGSRIADLGQDRVGTMLLGYWIKHAARGGRRREIDGRDGTTGCKDRWPKRGVNWAFFLFSKPLMRNLNNLTYTILGAQIHQTLVEEKTSYSRQVTQACKRY